MHSGGDLLRDRRPCETESTLQPANDSESRKRILHREAVLGLHKVPPCRSKIQITAKP